MGHGHEEAMNGVSSPGLPGVVQVLTRSSTGCRSRRTVWPTVKLGPVAVPTAGAAVPGGGGPDGHAGATGAGLASGSG